MYFNRIYVFYEIYLFTEFLFFFKIYLLFISPDNALEVCGLLTPLHIVPEWYFLCQYAMLKAIPNKNAGFIILLTSIFILFYLFYYYDQLLYELSVRFSLVDLELSLLLPYLHSSFTFSLLPAQLLIQYLLL